jgi:ATP-dependent Lon protease
VAKKGIKDDLSKEDLHIHMPSGAVKKDGPSAGSALTTVLISLFTKKPVRHDVAMTGEVTLRGKVMEIGGLKEKSLAALRAGIKTVLVPAENKRDMADIPKEVKQKLKFTFVKTMDDVLKVALR